MLISFIMIAYLFDGPLIPPTEGASTRVLNLMKYCAIKKPSLFWIVKVKREVDKIKDYESFSKKYGLNFLLLDKKFFYTKHGKRLLLILLKELGIKKIISKDMDMILSLWYLNKIYNISDFKFIFDSHDVVHETFQQFYSFTLKSFSTIQLKEVVLKELITHNVCDLHFTVSERDKKEYIKIGCEGRKIKIVENCVDLKEISTKKVPHKTFNVIFLGNIHYFPNYDALKIILNKIAPTVWRENKKIRFLIVGDCPTRLKKNVKLPNVTIIGKVKDLNKIFKISDLGIVPLRYGSGTRLKILYLLAAGIPVLTTRKGLEGLKIRRQNGIIIDKIDNFPKRILEFSTIRLNRATTRRVVKKYSAENVSEKMLKYLMSIETSRRPIKVVVFDLGYTLTNNAKAHEKTDKWLYQFLRKKYGIKLSYKDFRKKIVRIAKEFSHRYKGDVRLHDWENFYQLLFKRLNLKLKEPDIKKITRMYEKIFIKNIEVFPNSIEVLEHLKKNYVLAVITNDATERAMKILKKTGLKKYFDIIIISEQIGYEKISKKPFFYLIEKLKVRPSQVLVIGDSIDQDILPALECGMQAILVLRNKKKKIKEVPQNVRVVTNLKKIIEIITEINKL